MHQSFLNMLGSDISVVHFCMFDGLLELLDGFRHMHVLIGVLFFRSLRML